MKKFFGLFTLLIVSVACFGQGNTPNIGLQIPVTGSNNWYVPLNYNFTKIDQLLSGNAALPNLSVTGGVTVGGTVTAGGFTGVGGGSFPTINGTITSSQCAYWVTATTIGSTACSGTPGGTSYNLQYKSPGGGFAGSLALITAGGLITSQGENAIFNSDFFLSGSGNNGVAQAQASSYCNFGCTLAVPSTSTSTENYYAAVTKPNTFLQVYRYGSLFNYYYNAGQNTTSGQRHASATGCGWNDTDLNINQYPGATCFSEYSSLSSPTYFDSGTGQTMGHRQVTSWVVSPSILTLYNPVTRKSSPGDAQQSYGYQHYRCGVMFASDEGCKSDEVVQTQDAPPNGPIVTGGLGAMVVKVNFTNNGRNQGAGHPLVSTTEVLDTGLVTSQTSGSGYNLTSISGTWASHPSVSVLGTLASSCGVKSQAANPTQVTCLVNLVTGSFPTVGANVVCVGDYTHPERSTLVSSGTATSTQNLVLKMYYNHPASVPIYYGGGCGYSAIPGYGSATPMAPQSGSVTGEYPTYFVAGSKSTTSYDVINLLKGGQNGQQSIPISGLPIGQNPLSYTAIPLTSLTATSGTITGIAGYTISLLNNFTIPSGATLTISGSSNSTLNGNCTNPTYNADTSTFTCFLAGATGTATSASMSLLGMNNFVLACTANVTQLLNTTPLAPDGTGNPAGDGTMSIEANNCNWTPGNNASQPTFYNQDSGLNSDVSLVNTRPDDGLNGGHQMNIYGYGQSGGAFHILTSSDNISSYLGYGGNYTGHIGIWQKDFYASGYRATYAPIQGGAISQVDFDPPSTSNGFSINPSTQSYFYWNYPHTQIQVQPLYAAVQIYGYSWRFNQQIYQNGNAVLDASTFNGPYGGNLTLTTATSDTVTITGVSSTSHCVAFPRNVTAAGLTATTGAVYIGTPSTNTVTFNHAATTASGANYDVLCTKN